MALTAAEARERLASVGTSDWRDRRSKAIDRLSRSSRQAALEAVEMRREAKSLARLDSLRPKKRLRVFEALAPGHGEAVARTWDHLGHGPYQHRRSRRPFRAPEGRQLGLLKRRLWLANISELLWRYSGQDLVWLAGWASYLGSGSAQLGHLFAAEIDRGPDGDAVFEALTATVQGQHPVGVMGRHVVTGLLSSSRPEGWQAIEQLLLAAQRQEGLRQVILETVDEAHPEAFRRMLHLLVEEGLTRFAAVVRAVNVWLGFGFEAKDRAAVDAVLVTLAECLSDGAVIERHLDGDDAEAAYLALWSMAYRDVGQALRRADALLASGDVRIRFAATYLIGQTGVPEADPLLLAQLVDPDLRVAWNAFLGLGAGYRELDAPDAFDRVKAFATKLDTAETLDPLVWEWATTEIDRDQAVAAAVEQLRGVEPLRAVDLIDRMTANTRRVYALLLAGHHRDPEVRRLLLELAADRSGAVRDLAFLGLAKHRVTSEEAPSLEALLTRKTSSVRRSVLVMLQSQKDRDVLESARRLLDATNKLQREGGLDLLKEMIAADRSVEQCRSIVEGHAVRRTLSHEEQHLAEVIADDPENVTLEDCLGLIDPQNRTKPQSPTEREVNGSLETVARLLDAADDFMAAHRDVAVRHDSIGVDRVRLYGDVHWGIGRLKLDADDRPVASLWHEWWRTIGSALSDDDTALTQTVASFPQLDQYRSFSQQKERWEEQVAATCLPPRAELEYPRQVAAALRWLWMAELDAADVQLLLDAAETTLAIVPLEIRKRGPIDRKFDNSTQPNWDWRTSGALAWLSIARRAFTERPDAWDDDAVARLWGLLRWFDEPAPNLPRMRPQLTEVIAAYRIGSANDSDMIDHLLGSGGDRPGRAWAYFRDLGEVTRRRPPNFVEEVPGLPELVRVIVDRVLEVELGRGEMPTVASRPALAIRSVHGADRLVELMQALGRRSLTRGWTWDTQSPQAVLSHLIRVSMPAEGDTPEDFAKLAKTHKLSEARLLAVAMYAPQWAGYIERALEWSGLEESVHWLHAHTKDAKWRVDADIRDVWAAEVASRTPLTPQELTDGAVDVAWHRRCNEDLGSERWAKLDKAAKYASGGGGYKRAQLYATALEGALDEGALRARIDDKRHKDSVRALGLLPVPAEEPEHTEVMLSRYSAIQEFVRGSRKFGSQRRASEKAAAETGLDNLARTAGYDDPQRLQWAMETAAVADLADGPLVVERDPYTVTLSIDRHGEVALTTTNDGKKLKSVPAKCRKDDEIAELRSRKAELTRQQSRIRLSLETSMVRGDEFDPSELAGLMRHPLLRPMLERVVWIDRTGKLGYLDDAAGVLRRFDDGRTGIAHRVRIAHAHDLFRSGDWSQWQHECFAAERIQPFKQVFRELYVLTDGERADGNLTRRYAGHEVNPSQAMALLGSRGWIAHPEDGPSKTFHDVGLTVRLHVVDGWFTPAEVTGMALEAASFATRGDWRAIPLEDVPPRTFSEAMRDLDLVVSVAHVGGVDPEASASTVEMRQALVTETTSLLGLDNVSFAGSHAVIEGQLGSYSVHLGSAVVHQRPGGSVCIIPVSAQHRGRLFLPFADDDPKTAEVVSKVVMLARDKDIKDPTILEQLVG